MVWFGSFKLNPLNILKLKWNHGSFELNPFETKLLKPKYCYQTIWGIFKLKPDNQDIYKPLSRKLSFQGSVSTRFEWLVILCSLYISRKQTKTLRKSIIYKWCNMSYYYQVLNLSPNHINYFTCHIIQNPSEKDNTWLQLRTVSSKTNGNVWTLQNLYKFIIHDYKKNQWNLLRRSPHVWQKTHIPT